MRKIGFHCFDNAGGDALEMVAKAAQAMDHESCLFPKQIIGLAQTRGGELVNMDAMITGLSSFQTEEELAFAEVCEQFGVPWYVFEDVPGACLRPKAKNWAHRAKLVFLAHPSGADAAKEFGYVGSVYLGPPPQWRKEYLAIMEAKAKNIRGGMQKVASGGSLLPVQNADILIGAVGGKDPKENNRVLKLLVESITGIHRAVICFSEHPAEKPKPKADEPENHFLKRMLAYQRFIRERNEILSGVWAVSPRAFKGAEVAGSADVIVFFSGTNIQIGSAFAQIPNISLDDEGFRTRMKAQSGQEKWFVNELGGAQRVYTGDEMRIAIQALSHDSLMRDALRECQEENFPVSEDWSDLAAEHTEQKIVRFLEQIVTS